MILKIKAFIYRFSNIFGARLYLAKREEEEFLIEHRFRRLVEAIIEGEDNRGIDQFGLTRGVWHAQNGFTTVYTRNMGFFEGKIARIKHAFDFSTDSW
jgi:hypothetical protein